MYNLSDLWSLLALLKSSLPFVAAATILLAGLLASAVTWVEGYLTSHEHDLSPDSHSSVPEERAKQIRALSVSLKSRAESP